MGLTDFKASPRWIHRFKTKNRIGSRKITKFESQKQLNNAEDMQKTAEMFVASVRKDPEEVGPENLLNSDQSGINLETRAGRTLDFIGKKTVTAVAQSVNATTHSFTTQPTVNANGKFVCPLLLAYPEKNGCFGLVARKNMFKVII